MNVAIRKAWTRALRSGKYKQGHGVLHKGDQYCCLGVLCELAVQAGVTDREAGHGISGDEYTYGDRPHGRAVAFLPDVVIEWAGLDSHDPWIQDNDGLAALNDDEVPFPEIADLIDARL